MTSSTGAKSIPSSKDKKHYFPPKHQTTSLLMESTPTTSKRDKKRNRRCLAKNMRSSSTSEDVIVFSTHEKRSQSSGRVDKTSSNRKKVVSSRADGDSVSSDDFLLTNIGVEKRRSSPYTEKRRSSPYTEKRRSSSCTEKRRSSPYTEKRRSSPYTEKRRSSPNTEKRRSSPYTENFVKLSLDTRSVNTRLFSPISHQRFKRESSRANGDSVSSGDFLSRNMGAEKRRSSPYTEKKRSSPYTEKRRSSPYTEKRRRSSPYTDKRRCSSPCTDKFSKLSLDTRFVYTRRRSPVSDLRFSRSIKVDETVRDQQLILTTNKGSPLEKSLRIKVTMKRRRTSSCSSSDELPSASQDFHTPEPSSERRRPYISKPPNKSYYNRSTRDEVVRKRFRISAEADSSPLRSAGNLQAGVYQSVLVKAEGGHDVETGKPSPMILSRQHSSSQGYDGSSSKYSSSQGYEGNSSKHSSSHGYDGNSSKRQVFLEREGAQETELQILPTTPVRSWTMGRSSPITSVRTRAMGRSSPITSARTRAMGRSSPITSARTRVMGRSSPITSPITPTTPVRSRIMGRSSDCHSHSPNLPTPMTSTRMNPEAAPFIPYSSPIYGSPSCNCYSSPTPGPPSVANFLSPRSALQGLDTPQPWALDLVARSKACSYSFVDTHCHIDLLYDRAMARYSPITSPITPTTPVRSRIMGRSSDCHSHSPNLPTPMTSTRMNPEAAPFIPYSSPIYGSPSCNCYSSPTHGPPSVANFLSPRSALQGLDTPQPWALDLVARSKAYSYSFVDTHCHIDLLYDRLAVDHSTKFGDFQKQLASSFPVNYEGCLAVFCYPKTYAPDYPQDRLLHTLSQEDNIWFALGCHPKSATEFTARHAQSLRSVLSHPRVVALGEVGLDYSGSFHRHAEIQKTVLRQQLQMAVELQLPLVIHCRDAYEDCFAILTEMVPLFWKIHLHCFCDNLETARMWLDTFPNLYIGLTPVITYRSAHGPISTARSVPLDRLLLETDSPYFVPGSIKEARVSVSHPGFALFTAERIAELKNIPVETVLYTCRENTRLMYGI